MCPVVATRVCGRSVDDFNGADVLFDTICVAVDGDWVVVPFERVLLTSNVNNNGSTVSASQI